MNRIKPSLHLAVASRTRDAWRRAAYTLGYRIVRGSMAGDGNIGGLMAAMVGGDVPAHRLQEALAQAREGGQDTS